MQLVNKPKNKIIHIAFFFTILFSLSTIALVISLYINNNANKELNNSTIKSLLDLEKTKTILICILIYILISSSLFTYLITKSLKKQTKIISSRVDTISKGSYSYPIKNTEDYYFNKLLNNVNNLSDKLNEKQRSRERLFADISHELRTPLSVLHADIELLKDGIRPFNKESLESLERETARLRKFTEDIHKLSMSEIKKENRNITKLNITKCINSVIKTHEKHTKLEINSLIEKNHYINADLEEINQVLSNLISNSLIYTSIPGKIEFNIFLNNKDLIIVISDSAPSVDIKYCELIFNPLYRQKDSNFGNIQGSGLGLSICKNIINQYKGEIIATRSPYGGLKTIITLPTY